jgi:hypothetical protein
MEVTKSKPFQGKNIREFFLGEKKPFVEKREINWPLVKRAAIAILVFGVVGLLVMPASKEEAKTFHEKVDHVKSTLEQRNEMNPTDDTVNQIARGKVDSRSVPDSLDHLYAPSGGGSVGGPKQKGSNSSMILTRGGLDSHTQLPPGTRIRVRLLERVTVANQAIPVIGLVTGDVEHENGAAIQTGSKLYGEITFDESTERGSVNFRSIRMPDGRERQISGIAVSLDGQSGIEGKIHSEALKNSIGQTLTRFIGAYADGSMERGSFGGNPGGASNGLKNAIAETAKDRAEVLGESLSQEKKWLELPSGSEFLMVLNQAFTFREPGAFHGE